VNWFVASAQHLGDGTVVFDLGSRSLPHLDAFDLDAFDRDAPSRSPTISTCKPVDFGLVPAPLLAPPRRRAHARFAEPAEAPLHRR